MGVEVQQVAPKQVQDVLVGVHDIPETFLKPQNLSTEQADSGEDDYPSSTESIPVIDMADVASADVDDVSTDWTKSAAAQDIVRACKELGFMQVVNHGVPHELLQRMQELALSYFSLPSEERAMDWAILPPSRYGRRDWNDAMIHFNRPPKPDHVTHSKLPDGYRDVLESCVEEILKLAKRVVRVLSVGLGLPPTRLEEVMGEFDVVTRVNYYPPCPRPELVRGLTSHSDFGILTVLSQNDVEGLQVLKDGQWRTVKVLPNSLVVNVADMFEILTNGAYVSCDHRAIVNSHSLRLSLGWFMYTEGDLSIGPLPDLLSDHQPPLYKSVSYNEYLTLGRSLGFTSKSLLENHRLAPEKE